MFVFFSSCNSKHKEGPFTHAVSNTHFENSILIEGLVEPIQFTTLACPGNVDGIVTFLIDNGTHVDEGDVVCIIEDNNQQNNHDNLEIALENAVAELSKVNADLKMQYALLEAQVKMALENRLEVREQEIQIELQKLNIKQQRANGMIRGSIDGYFERAGVDQQTGVGLVSSIKNSYSNLLDRNASYGVGLTITIPILDWGENRALVRASESRLKQYNYRKEEVEREIETEVKNLIASINSNLKRLQVLERNVSVAEKSFDITRQRFSDGDIDSQGLALERNRLNNAYTSHLRAYINYQLSLADLTRKTFYDFQAREEVE